MPNLILDLRYGIRQLIKSPGFALTAIISLALGIGATTAVFSVVYAALINPYPYPNADRIVRLIVEAKAGRDTVTLNGPQIQELTHVPLLDSVLAMQYHPLTLTGHDLPENVNAVSLISNGFADLGLPPLLGRGILPSDAVAGHAAQPVVVLSYKFWQKHFFSDPDVVGKLLQLDHKTYTIVGVAAPRFIWYSADVYLPLALTSLTPDCFVDVRLRPGVSQKAANQALQALLNQFAKSTPKQFPEHFKVNVEDLNAWVVRGMSGTLYLLLGAVGLLLAIGCGNVSILLLARGTARQHELAVRAAVGANRSRLVMQMLTESLALALMGAALGVALSYGILAGIKALLPRFAFAPEVVIHINIPVLLFSVAIALTTGILFGVWPALQLSRAQPGQSMHSSARRVAGSVHGRRTHRALIAGQIALTLLLLAGAGSAMEGFLRLVHTPLGYEPHNAISLGIPLHDNSYTAWAARATYFERLRAKVAETPGVLTAAISTNATPPHSGWNSRFDILGRPAMEQQMGAINLVGPGYFPTLRIPLLQGRIWNHAENQGGAHLAVVNRAFADRYFPNSNVIGHSVKLPDLEDRPPDFLTVPKLAESWLPVIGVVGDSRNDGLSHPVKPAIYVPYTLALDRGTEILVRTAVAPTTLVHAMRQKLTEVNPDQQTYSMVEDLDTWIAEEPDWQQEHLAAWIFGVFAGLALALAAVGLFSVVSYTVVQRTNEFGIRMALGAQQADVLRIVFASTVVSVGTGLGAGLALTIALNSVVGRWAQNNSRDPVILIVGTLLLSLVAALACAIPARHASEIDPMTALRVN